MNKKILLNIKRGALMSILPLLLAACEQKKPNVDAEIADIENNLAKIQIQLDSIDANVDSIMIDSIANDKKISEISEKIVQHSKRMAKLSAPKDSVLRKKFSKKIGTLRMDSILHAHNLRDEIAAQQHAANNDIFAMKNALVAKRDSLMKIKTR